jgi:hypothetical protein
MLILMKFTTGFIAEFLYETCLIFIRFIYLKLLLLLYVDNSVDMALMLGFSDFFLWRECLINVL